MFSQEAPGLARFRQIGKLYGSQISASVKSPLFLGRQLKFGTILSCRITKAFGPEGPKPTYQSLKDILQIC